MISRSKIDKGMASRRSCPIILFRFHRFPRAKAPRQAAPNTTPTNVTNKTGWSGVSFLRGSCRIAVARHNNRANRHCASAQITGTASSRKANSITGPPPFHPFAAAQITRSLRGEHHCPSHSGKFRDERRWDPPRATKMMSCRDGLQRASQKLNQALPTRPRAQDEIVRSYSVIRPKTSQVISKRSRTTLTDFQMVNARCWFVKNLLTSLAQPIGKFSLKVIRYAHKLLVKSTQFKGDFAAHREIAAHKFTYPSRFH